MTRQKGKKAATKAAGKVSAKLAAIQVPQRARKPMPVKEIAERHG